MVIISLIMFAWIIINLTSLLRPLYQRKTSLYAFYPLHNHIFVLLFYQTSCLSSNNCASPPHSILLILFTKDLNLQTSTSQPPPHLPTPQYSSQIASPYSDYYHQSTATHMLYRKASL